jgi:hypothetical protein
MSFGPARYTRIGPEKERMKTQTEYMSDTRLDSDIISRLAHDIGQEQEYPCGWSWDMGCYIDCPIKDKKEIRRIRPSDERLKCVFDGTKMCDTDRLFLARTWNALQLMGMDLDEA